MGIVARSEKLVLLRHPDNYQETVRHLKIDPTNGPDTSFESWDDLILDPKYMVSPIDEMIAQIRSDLAAVGLDKMRKSLENRLGAETTILDLMSGWENEGRADIPTQEVSQTLTNGSKI